MAKENKEFGLKRCEFLGFEEVVLFASLRTPYLVMYYLFTHLIIFLLVFVLDIACNFATAQTQTVRIATRIVLKTCSSDFVV